MRILPRLAFQAVDDGDGVGWMATWVVSFWRAHLYRPLGHGVPRQITKKIVRLKRVGNMLQLPRLQDDSPTTQCDYPLVN